MGTAGGGGDDELWHVVLGDGWCSLVLESESDVMNQLGTDVGRMESAAEHHTIDSSAWDVKVGKPGGGEGATFTFFAK